MSGPFNPYLEWLGLAIDEKSKPNHYELFGVPLYESDIRVISTAANRAMSRVRGFLPGDHVDQWARLLEELQTAKECLCDVGIKDAYDRQLQLADHQFSDRSTQPPETSAAVPVNPANTPDSSSQSSAGETDETAPDTPAATAETYPAGNPAPMAPLTLDASSPSDTPTPLDNSTPDETAGSELPNNTEGFADSVEPVLPIAIPVATRDAPVPQAIPNQSADPMSPYAVPSPQSPHESAGAPHGSEPLPYAIPASSSNVTGGPDSTGISTSPPYEYAHSNDSSSPGPHVEAMAPFESARGNPPSAPNAFHSPKSRKTASALASTRSQRMSQAIVVGGLAVAMLLLAVSVFVFVLSNFTQKPIGPVAVNSIDEQLPDRKHMSAKESPGAPEKKPEKSRPTPLFPPNKNGAMSPQKPRGESVPRPSVPRVPPGKTVTPPKTMLEPPAPPSIPITPEELDQLREALTAARHALGERNLDLAAAQLLLANRLAKLPEHQGMLDRLQLLHEYVGEFWTVVAEGMQQLNEQGELPLGERIVSVVEANQERILIRDRGRNREFARMELPPKLAQAIAENRLDKESPENKVCLGAFLAVDPDSNPNDARSLWQQAQRAGVLVAGELLPVLTDDYDRIGEPDA